MQSAHSYSGSLQAAPSPREKRHAALARKAAAAGIVLLRNDGVLPLAPDAPAALFGAGAGHTVKGGIGSGDVNNRANVSLYEGLQEAGVALTSEDWITDYEHRYTAARLSWKEKVLADAKTVENPFDAYAANPFVLPQGRPLQAADLTGAAVALYVISRISGEGKDRTPTAGDYLLSEREAADLRTLDEAGLPLVLILNAGGPVELTDLLEEYRHPLAVLQISQPGQQGGEAVADILLGKAVPEGKLTATWAKRYADYPCADTFGACNGDLEKEDYTEGLYVGYRWFDSFGIEPLFGFGHGLSYTTFSTTFTALRPGDHGVEVDLTVTNTGDRFTGREVVQVYAACPQTGTAREYRRLAGFAKTRPLAPGKSQGVTVAVPAKQLAEFLPGRGAWVIPARGLHPLCGGQPGGGRSLRPPDRGRRGGAGDHPSHLPRCTIPLGKWALPPWPWKKPRRLRPWTCPLLSLRRCPTEAPAPAPVPLADGPVEELVPMLYGNITQRRQHAGLGGHPGARLRGGDLRGAGSLPGRPLPHHGGRPCRAAAAAELPGGPRRRWGDPHRGAGLAGKRFPGSAPTSGRGRHLLPVLHGLPGGHCPGPELGPALLEEFGRAIAARWRSSTSTSGWHRA